MAPLEKSLLDAKEAGVSVLRCACLSGRRYETFESLADWKRWVDQSHDASRRVVPLLEKHKLTLAVENHSHWTLDDMQRFLKTYQRQYLGVGIDFGNRISLLDDPMEVIEGLALYVKAGHIKGIGFRQYQDGFEMSEVPLLDPSGQYLHVAHQNTANIVSFKVDINTGALAPSGRYIASGSSTCIVFGSQG